MRRVSTYVIVTAMLISVVYVFVAYLRTAGLFYNPPWDDPLFYLSALAGLGALGVGASGFAMQKGLRTALLIGGLLVIAECGGAAWFDHSFRRHCDSLPPGSFAPGCPDLPYKAN